MTDREQFGLGEAGEDKERRRETRLRVHFILKESFSLLCVALVTAELVAIAAFAAFRALLV